MGVLVEKIGFVPDLLVVDAVMGNELKSLIGFIALSEPLAVVLFLICSLGDVRKLNENSAYSKSFSPDIGSSKPNSLSSSELSVF